LGEINTKISTNNAEKSHLESRKKPKRGRKNLHQHWECGVDGMKKNNHEKRSGKSWVLFLGFA